MGDGLKTYINIFFSSEGPDPTEVIEVMEKLGAKAIVGPWDFEIESNKESLMKLLKGIHGALKGKGVIYNLTSVDKGFTDENNLLK